MILYGFRLGHAVGVPEAFQRSVSFPIHRTRVTRVTRDVLSTGPIGVCVCVCVCVCAQDTSASLFYFVLFLFESLNILQQ